MGQFGIGLQNLKMAYDLSFVSMSPLGLLLVWKWDRVWGEGFEQICCPWCGLGRGAKNWPSVERKSQKPGAQSEYHAEIGTSDHHFMWAQIGFNFDLNWVWLFPKVLINV